MPGLYTAVDRPRSGPGSPLATTWCRDSTPRPQIAVDLNCCKMRSRRHLFAGPPPVSRFTPKFWWRSTRRPGGREATAGSGGLCTRSGSGSSAGPVAPARRLGFDLGHNPTSQQSKSKTFPPPRNLSLVVDYHRGHSLASSAARCRSCWPSLRPRCPIRDRRRPRRLTRCQMARVESALARPRPTRNRRSSTCRRRPCPGACPATCRRTACSSGCFRCRPRRRTSSCVTLGSAPLPRALSRAHSSHRKHRVCVCL